MKKLEELNIYLEKPEEVTSLTHLSNELKLMDYVYSCVTRIVDENSILLDQTRKHLRTKPLWTRSP